MYEKDLVSVIVVNWKREDLLKECLNSIFSQTYRNLEVIVIENSASCNSLNYLGAFPLKIISHRENLHYAFSQNQGIREARGEFVLSLNNDVVLKSDFLEEVIDAIKRDEKIGIVSGKILSLDGKFIDSCGQILGRSRKPVERGYGAKDSGQFDKPEFVFGASGACALYRKNMLEEVKLKEGEYFDSDYGLFYEDLDLNWRANLMGWKAYYNPKAVAYHSRGSSARLHRPRFSIFKRFEFCCLIPEHKWMLLRNRYATIIKNETIEGFLRNLFFIFLYDLFLWIYLLLFEPCVIIKFIKGIKFLYRERVFRKRRG